MDRQIRGVGGEVDAGVAAIVEAVGVVALPEAGIGLGVLAIRNQVQNFLLLLRRAVEKNLLIAINAGVIQPHQPAAEGDLIIQILAGEQVDEFRCTRLDRALGVLVRRDDGLAKTLQRFVGRRRKELGSVSAALRRLLRLHHVVGVFRRFQRNDAQH